MEDYAKIFNIHSENWNYALKDKFLIERIGKTYYELFNVVSFLFSFSFFMIWDLKREIFPFKNSNKF
jgi:hypothetical protein